VLAQPQLIVRFMTVKSKQALNRGVMIGGAFILCMTGVAFTVGALSNAYFARNEAVVCDIQDKEALLDPGPKGDAVLKPVLPEASDEVKKRAKKFVAYRLPGEPESQPLRYILRTPGMKFEKTADGKRDVIRPGLISIARSIDAGTTMKGDVDKIIPKFVDSAFPRWFGVVFLLTLLAAAMSTLSSQFHTMGTAIGRDVVERLTRSEPGRSITITRLGIVVGLIVAVVLGKIVGDNIIALATAIFFGLCAAAFLPAFVGGLFWRRMTRTGAIASIVTGFLVSTLWLLFINGKTAGGVGICNALFDRPNLVPAGWSVTWTVVDPLFVALPISVLVAIAVSLLTRPMDKAYVDYCFGGPKPEAR
jgi:SSS family solute:Na+ symporter